MPYFVLAPDGNRYGPADVATLNQWVAQGRLLPHQTVEDATSGARMLASQVPGLQFSSAPPQAFAPGEFGKPVYPNPMAYGYADDGASDVKKAWFFAGLGMLCFPPFAIGGIVCARRAQRKGHPGATAPLVSSWGALILGIILVFVALSAVGQLRSLNGLDQEVDPSQLPVGMPTG